MQQMHVQYSIYLHDPKYCKLSLYSMMIFFKKHDLWTTLSFIKTHVDKVKCIIGNV